MSTPTVIKSSPAVSRWILPLPVSGFSNCVLSFNHMPTSSVSEGRLWLELALFAAEDCTWQELIITLTVASADTYEVLVPENFGSASGYSCILEFPMEMLGAIHQQAGIYQGTLTFEWDGDRPGSVRILRCWIELVGLAGTTGLHNWTQQPPEFGRMMLERCTLNGWRDPSTFWLATESASSVGTWCEFQIEKAKALTRPEYPNLQEVLRFQQMLLTARAVLLRHRTQ